MKAPYHRHIILLVLILGQLCMAQSSKLKKANKLFLNRAYFEAATIYEDVADTKESLVKLGDCYYYNGLMVKASNTYYKALGKDTLGFSDDVNFRYAHALYGMNQIGRADSIMGVLNDKPINTKNFVNRLKNGVPYNYKVVKLNSGGLPGDFGMNFFGKNVVFSSTRDAKGKLYKWNGEPYLDLFQAELTDERTLINVEPFGKTINSRTHESNAIISEDGKTMYFSRTNDKRYEINEEKIATVKLFKSVLGEDGWSTAEELPFCSNLYSVQHPSLDEDNNRLYFSSDMPGGFGSFDIYYVTLKEDGFGDPINLGEKINTKHREQFPFYSNDDVLYFASNGHQGLGGLDTFMAEKNSVGWDTPLNLGATLNTTADDFSFAVDSNTDKGFISSNRDGNDNMYIFTREDNLRTYIVEGSVMDKNSKELLPKTLVRLFDPNNKVVDSVTVGDDGRYLFRTKPNTKYLIEGFRPLYIPSTVEFATDDSGRIELNIELVLESYDDAEEIIVEKEDGYVYIELENIYFDLDKWDIKPQAANTLNILVDLMKKYPRMEVQLGAHTDSRSSFEYNLELSKNRAQSALEYIISNGIEKSRLTAIGYGKSRLLIDCGDNCTENEHAINRRCEFVIVK
jgi:outer membrane protein OmpA-like peptidoglycan-associated protein/tetratricopeptide (TPR) repeat protein